MIHLHEASDHYWLLSPEKCFSKLRHSVPKSKTQESAEENLFFFSTYEKNISGILVEIMVKLRIALSVLIIFLKY